MPMNEYTDNLPVIYALAYMTVLLIWLGICERRIIDKIRRRLIMSAGIMIVLWLCIFAVNFQIEEGSVVSHYLELSHIALALATGGLMFLLSVSLDNSDGFVTHMKGAVISVSIGYGLSFIAIYTNDLHGLVLSRDPISGALLCGPLYMIFATATAALFAVGYVVMVKRASSDGCRKKLAIATGVVLVVGIVHTLRHMGLVTFIKQKDLTLDFGALYLLYCELAMRAGLIPRSRKYSKLFSHSPLKMQIVDKEGTVAMISQQAIPVPKRIFTFLAKGDGEFFDKRSNTMYYMTGIRGGSVIWQEDVNSLVRLNKKIDMNIRLLESSNKILSMQRDILAQNAGTHAKNMLLEQLDEDLKSKYDLMIDMIEDLPKQSDKKLEVARITLLLVYIKRRCNLFFRELETGRLPVDELVVYIDELAEFAKFTGVIMHTSCELHEDIPVREGTLFYDLLYAVVRQSSLIGEYNLIEQLVKTPAGGYELKLLLSDFPEDMSCLEPALLEEIEKKEGKLGVRKLDDLVSITLSFEA